MLLKKKKNATGSPSLVYWLLFSIFLRAHCELGDGWFRGKMMSNRCEANPMEKEELTCSPFKMIDSMAPHASSGSSWPTPRSTLQGDLTSTARALRSPWLPGGSVCVVCANKVWVMELGSLTFQAIRPASARGRQRAALWPVSLDQRQVSSSSRWDHPRDLSWMIVRQSKGPKPLVSSHTIWGWIYHPRQLALQTATCMSLAREVAGITQHVSLDHLFHYTGRFKISYRKWMGLFDV